MKIFNPLILLSFLTLVFLSTQVNAQLPHQFDTIRLEEIRSANLSPARISGTNLPADTILLYRTNEGRHGKLLIKTYGYNLIIRWSTFNPNGSLHSKGDNLTIRGTYSCDLDSGKETQTSSDFWWEQVSATERYLTPKNGANFALYSRCGVQGIKRIYTSPSKIRWQVQYYIPPSHPKACFISSYIPNRENQSSHFRYNPAGREPSGVPKGQHYFSDNVVFEAEYLGSQPYTSSTIEVVIYEKNQNLCSSILNWGQTWRTK
ncbi:MAG: hypothetical protein QXY90_06760 [Candidatus Anstonellales archaeon]